MAAIDYEAYKLFRKVRDQYPETYEWVKHKAKWEGMVVGAVCMEYHEHVMELMLREDNKNDGLYNCNC